MSVERLLKVNVKRTGFKPFQFRSSSLVNFSFIFHIFADIDLSVILCVSFIGLVIFYSFSSFCNFNYGHFV